MRKGDVYGRLTVVDLIAEMKGNKVGPINKVKCMCECGKETVKLVGSVEGGSTRSCGCLARESRLKNVKKARAARTKNRELVNGN